MHTIQRSIELASEKLTAITDIPQLEAEILLAHTLAKPRTYLFSRPEEMVSSESFNSYMHYVMRRTQHEPIAYITGKKEFWSLDLTVNQSTLIPRPETELLIETTLAISGDSMRIADLGTGSGAIALAIANERPSWKIFATDTSDGALAIAKKNAESLGLTNITFYQGNWCDALPRDEFDIIVSNPPYISEQEWPQYAGELAFEPKQALVSGKDGLDAIREISQKALSKLKSGGYLIVEHGYAQGEAVRKIFAVEGFCEIYSLLDLSGKERVTIAVKQ